MKIDLIIALPEHRRLIHLLRAKLSEILPPVLSWSMYFQAYIV